MKEKILSVKKNGLKVAVLLSLLMAADILIFIISIAMGHYDPYLPLFIPSLIFLIVGWFFFNGLKVIKPQEALVLTLFGEYIGTLKEPGFYYVNPFCTAINPAAKTKLGQSRDVNKNEGNTSDVNGRKISLKEMTLSNAVQKVNDVLGNPVEIGVAVIWKVEDTAPAVFNVGK